MKNFLSHLILSLLALLILLVSPPVARADHFSVDAFVIIPLGSTTIQCPGSANFRIVISGRGASHWPGSPSDQINAGLAVVDVSGFLTQSFVGLGTFNFADSITLLQDDIWILTRSFTLECTPQCHLIGHGVETDVTLDSNSALLKGQLAAFSPVGGGVVAESNTLRVSCEVPEPASMFLLGTGLAGVAMKMRKRFKSSKSGR